MSRWHEAQGPPCFTCIWWMGPAWPSGLCDSPPIKCSLPKGLREGLWPEESSQDAPILPLQGSLSCLHTQNLIPALSNHSTLSQVSSAKRIQSLLSPTGRSGRCKGPGSGTLHSDCWKALAFACS